MDKEYLAKKKDLLNGIAINQTTIGTQCKNLLNHTLETTEINGVTITVNKDKSITINGEATSDIKILLGKIKDNKKNNLILSGCPDGGSRSSYNLELAWTNMSYNDSLGEYIMVSQEEYDIGKNYTYICKKGDSKHFDISLIIKRGTVMSNHIFKPMVRYADIIDETYEPYKENVDERIIKNTSDIDVNKSDITVNKSDTALIKTALGYECKNLIKPIYQTSTIQGVTFTVNSDNSITTNGTNNLSNSDANLKIFDQQLEPGTYTLTGAVNETFRMRLGVGSGNTLAGKDIGNGFTFTVSKKERYVILCQVPMSETADNVTFYPMLRYADITDNTYEPYKENLIELYNSLLGSFVNVDLSKITFDTGISLTSDPANRLRYKKMGNMVFIDCRLILNVDSTYANITTSIASSIPTGYNPSKIQTLLGRWINYVNDTNSNSGIVMCQIGSNKLTLYLPDNKPLKNISNINFNISGMYTLD